MKRICPVYRPCDPEKYNSSINKAKVSYIIALNTYFRAFQRKAGGIYGGRWRTGGIITPAGVDCRAGEHLWGCGAAGSGI